MKLNVGYCIAFGSRLFSWLFVSKYLFSEIILATVATFHNVGFTFFVSFKRKSSYSTITANMQVLSPLEYVNKVISGEITEPVPFSSANIVHRTLSNKKQCVKTQP
jgi:hypothetical protein